MGISPVIQPCRKTRTFVDDAPLEHADFPASRVSTLSACKLSMLMTCLWLMTFFHLQSMCEARTLIPEIVPLKYPPSIPASQHPIARRPVPLRTAPRRRERPWPWSWKRAPGVFGSRRPRQPRQPVGTCRVPAGYPKLGCPDNWRLKAIDMAWSGGWSHDNDWK